MSTFGLKSRKYVDRGEPIHIVMVKLQLKHRYTAVSHKQTRIISFGRMPFMRHQEGVEPAGAPAVHLHAPLT